MSNSEAVADGALAATPFARDRLPAVLAGCVENLRAVYRVEDGLFPYSSRLAGGAFVNDYRRPTSLRYTLNTLLGLGRAARVGVAGLTPSEVDSMIATFNRLHASGVADPADLGMLTLLNAENPGADGSVVAEGALHALEAAVAPGDPKRFNMQDLGWMIWGAAAATRAGVARADGLGRTATGLVREHFVDARTGLPRHSVRPYRRSIVSFGSLTYFLRAMHEAATAFGDEQAASLFSGGVRRALGLQGPQGEWPWLLHVGSGDPIDAYPIFSVHQDSMAMLFLLPALDAGEPGVAEGIDRSLAWCFGENELGAEFYRSAPFSAARSIERPEGERRLQRYLRFLAYTVTRRSGGFGARNTRVNEECRSYHLGWILFAWAERLAVR